MDTILPARLGPRLGLPCCIEDMLYGVSERWSLILDGGLSSSTISKSCSGNPGTLSYWEALDPRSEPGTKPLERGRRWDSPVSSGLEGAGDAPRLMWTSRAAAAFAASSLVSEGLNQRGVISLRELEAALELWFAVALL